MTRAPSIEEPYAVKVARTVLKASGEGDLFAEPNRALRPYVIWRKTSFASQSLRGLAFRERILSVVGTARNLGLNTHQLLRRVCAEGLQGRPITPLPIDQPRLPKSA